MRLAGIIGIFLGVILTLQIAEGRSANGIEILKLVSKTEDNALDLQVSFGTDVIRARGKLGLSVPAAVGQWTHCNDEQTCVQWGDFAKVELTTGSAPGCGRVEWTSAYAREIEDCYDIEDGVHWYGGGETYIQTWPIENNPRVEGPYVTSDFFRDTVNYYGGVVENYWLLSNGAALVVDPDTPLFFSLNTTHRDRVCFVARDQAPYTKREPLTLKYEWCTAENVKEAHKLERFYDDCTL